MGTVSIQFTDLMMLIVWSTGVALVFAIVGYLMGCRELEKIKSPLKAIIPKRINEVYDEPDIFDRHIPAGMNEKEDG